MVFADSRVLFLFFPFFFFFFGGGGCCKIQPYLAFSSHTRIVGGRFNKSFSAYIIYYGDQLVCTKSILLGQGSIHSGSVRWDKCGRADTLPVKKLYRTDFFFWGGMGGGRFRTPSSHGWCKCFLLAHTACLPCLCKIAYLLIYALSDTSSWKNMDDAHNLFLFADSSLAASFLCSFTPIKCVKN